MQKQINELTDLELAEALAENTELAQYYTNNVMLVKQEILRRKQLQAEKDILEEKEKAASEKANEKPNYNDFEIMHITEEEAKKEEKK